MAWSTYLSTNFCMSGLEKSAGCNCPYFPSCCRHTALLGQSQVLPDTSSFPSLHSCLFCVGFAPETFVKLRWRKTEVSHLKRVPYLIAAVVSWWLRAFCFSGSFWKEEPIIAAQLFASWEEVKKKRRKKTSFPVKQQHLLSKLQMCLT